MKQMPLRSRPIPPLAPMLTCFLLAACAAEAPHDTADAPDQGAAADVHRVDRLGRMEVTNTLLQEHKESYNREDAFDVPPLHLEQYEAALSPNLEVFDQMDGTQDWPPVDGLHPLTRPFLQDYLIVDLSKPCTVDSRSYLEIEKSQLRGVDDSTCGGRTPNDDAMDVLLTLLVNGPDRDEPWRTDGVDGATKPATDIFPYLAAPND